MDVNEYAERLFQETLAAAATADGENPANRLEVFTGLVAQRLASTGDISDFMPCYHKARGVEVSGYAVEEDGASLHLFVTDYRGVVPPESLTDTQVQLAFKRLA